MKNQHDVKLLGYVKKGGRVFVHMNTGTITFRPKKGKGSYRRLKKIRDYDY
jgi:hypothetical protein